MRHDEKITGRSATPMRRKLMQQVCLYLSVLVAVPLAAQRAPEFKSEVLPVLKKSCVKCHSAESGKQKMAGLDLSSFDSMMAGSSNGPVIAPGKPERSLLWMMIDNGQMPMGGKLTAEEKQLFKAYIELGRFPAQDDEVAQKAREAARITPEARKWWSFQRPIKYPAPNVKNKDQVKTPIDAFILAELEGKSWKMQPEASRRTLVRRAYLDLVGLPPTPEEVRTFIDDKSPNAYEKVVDKLLTSPHYGESWGRHWLDVAGYSDSRGDASDNEREVSWKYRDYVIRAFNKNIPYNRFIMEQFAGDQMVNYEPGTKPKPDQVDPLIATGFLRTTADITDNQSIYEVDKYFDALQKATDTSLSVVMGMTIGCARCHDHKFDPILQKDYYKLSSVFQAVYDPENWLAGDLNHGGPWPSRMVLDMEPAQREAWIKAVTNNDAKALLRETDLIEATLQRFRAELKVGKDLTPELREQIRKDIANDPDLQVDNRVVKDFISDVELVKRFPEMAKWKDSIQERYYATSKTDLAPNYIEAAWDVSKKPSPTYILQRGNYLAPGAAVNPGLPAVLDDPQHPFQFPEPAAHPEWHHTGRRLALAQWFTRPDNPLTARVFVNRLWQFHFGEGIVRSVDDFGVQGGKPTHPELLDYLATSFVEHGWDIKWLTKQIMMSHVYRQDSAESAAQMTADPADKLLWRKAPLRLEAETIRDSMLAVSGLLSNQMFGRQEPLKRGADGQWLEDDKKGHANRRSLYLAYARTRPEGFMHAFDGPEMVSDNVSQRFRSALPAQSLALLNNPLVMRTSHAFADQVMEQSKGNLDEAIGRAFEAAYSRPPTAKELALAKMTISEDSNPKSGLRLFIQGMMGANNFLYSY
jgi:Protein of unknown function (DUF1553)/Protein of unknown function (DUF1549)/Planctomycete cytochrome C